MNYELQDFKGTSKALKLIKHSNLIKRKLYWTNFEIKMNIWQLRYLTRYLSSVEHWALQKISLVIWQWMNINWIKPFISFEILLPKRWQWQWPNRQKHESNFANPLKWILLHLRLHRRTPKQLLISHIVQQFWRRFDPPLETSWFFPTYLKAWSCLRNYIWDSIVPGHIHTSNEKADAKGRQKAKNFKYSHWKHSRLSSLCQILPLLYCQNPSLHPNRPKKHHLKNEQKFSFQPACFQDSSPYTTTWISKSKETQQKHNSNDEIPKLYLWIKSSPFSSIKTNTFVS